MKTEFDYLKLLDEDLALAAKRENLLGPAPRRRRRINWGGIVAASVAFLVVAGLIGLISQGGLGSSDNAGTAAGGASGATGADSDRRALETVPGMATPGTAGPQPRDLSKIIRNGGISIRVPDGSFEQKFAAVTRVAENNGGFVLSSATRGARSGSMTLRIPAARFDEAMLALRSLGTVERQEITGRDVTAQFVDLQARLAIMKQRRALLLNLQSHATTATEILRLATLVERTQLQIEQVQGQLNFIEDQVAEATIRVSLHEQDALNRTSETADDGLDVGTAFGDAVDGFLDVVSVVIVGLGYLIPIAMIGLVVGMVVALVRRGRRRVA
jgi:hypothetical protein